MLTHGALFNGIGGFQLAASWLGIDNTFHCEIDKKCNALIAKRFPNSICHEAIETTSFISYRHKIDILTGGFPCQPFSNAGKQRGASDPRYLVHQYARVIKEIESPFFIAENVPGILRHEFNKICSLLAGKEYTIQPFCIPSSSAGGLSNRNRVWIIGVRWDAFYSDTNRKRWNYQKEYQHWWTKQGGTELPDYEIDITRQMVSKGVRNGSDPRIFGVADGLPSRMDRLKQIGNAIDPRVAYKIMKTISS